MPTKVQLEAMELIKDRKRSEELCENVFGTMTTVLNRIFPGTKILGKAVMSAGKAVSRYADREYDAELQKAARGDRDTLPPPPPESRNDTMN